MKTTKERLTSVRLAIINAEMRHSTRKIVLEFFDEKYKKQFEEAPGEVLEIFQFILGELRSANSKYTIFINELLADCLKRHEYQENWVQLNQVRRSLPDQIINSVRDEDMVIKELVINSANIIKEFEDFSLEDKKRLMEGVNYEKCPDQHSEGNRNFETRSDHEKR